MKVVKPLLILSLILLPIWAVFSSAQKEVQAQNLALQPMTVNGSFYAGGTQPDIAEVKAFIGSKECGKVSAQRQVAGNTTYTFSIPVKSTTQEEGCGTNGAAVTFTLNNVSVPVNVPGGFQSGATVDTVLVKLTTAIPSLTPTQTPTMTPTHTPTHTSTPTLTPTPVNMQGMIVRGIANLNGTRAPVGTVITAKIGNVSCGTVQTWAGQEYNYQFTVLPSQGNTGCGTNGAAVTFSVGNLTATPTATYQDGTTQTITLNAGTIPTNTPTPTTSGNPTATPTPSTNRTIPDVNGDGVVTSIDSLCVQRRIQGLGATQNCPVPLPFPDVNSDGTVNMADSDCVLSYLGGFPASATCPFTMITPTPQGNVTLTPTIPAGNLIKIAFSMRLRGIGPDVINGQTATPTAATRPVTLYIYNSQNSLVTKADGEARYNPASGYFGGVVDVLNVPTGQYTVQVMTDNSLRKAIPGIQNLTVGQTYTAPAQTLITGDLNHDNKLSIVDYNLMLKCKNTNTCSPKEYQEADLNSDGVVEGRDINILLKEFGTIYGDDIDEELSPMTISGSVLSGTSSPTIPEGVIIQAYNNTASRTTICGTTTSYRSEASTYYTITVNSSSQNPNCFKEGDTVILGEKGSLTTPWVDPLRFVSGGEKKNVDVIYAPVIDGVQ